ncbi:MAG: hypothetical protein RSC56_03775 [Acidaminococcaceae bacterium]
MLESFDTALTFLGLGMVIGGMIFLLIGAILAIPIALFFLHGVYEVIISPIAKGLWEGFREGYKRESTNLPPKAPSESH